jgi:hypothetical protein
MQRVTWILLTLAAVSCGRADAEPVAATATTTPVVFDGLGLDDFKGTDSVASALRGIEADSNAADLPLGVPIDMLVRGPSGRGTSSDSLAAEVRSRIEGIALTAGMQADLTVIQDGPAKWVGGLGVSSDHALGREVLELKTSLGRSQNAGILGVEIGPRIERRLRGGMLIFLDGKAQAQARRSADTGEWMLPRLAEQEADAAGAVGVTASTGVVR